MAPGAVSLMLGMGNSGYSSLPVESVAYLKCYNIKRWSGGGGACQLSRRLLSAAAVALPRAVLAGRQAGRGAFSTHRPAVPDGGAVILLSTALLHTEHK